MTRKRSHELSVSIGQYSSFVVRIWSRGAEEGMTHGRVTHVGTRKSTTFRTLDELTAFVRTHVGPGGDPPDLGLMGFTSPLSTPAEPPQLAPTAFA